MHKEILYIHGYNSHGNTGKSLEKLVAKHFNIKVHHFSIPEKANEAIYSVNNYLAEHKDIGIIIGSSLGGFVTMQIPGYIRLVINPCLKPSLELPKLGADENLVISYKEYEDKWLDLIDSEDRLTTFSMFSNSDELFSYKYVFDRYFLKKNIVSIPNAGHHLNEQELEEYVIPYLDNILNNEQNLIHEYLENFNSFIVE